MKTSIKELESIMKLMCKYDMATCVPDGYGGFCLTKTVFQPKQQRRTKPIEYNLAPPIAENFIPTEESILFHSSSAPKISFKDLDKYTSAPAKALAIKPNEDN